MSVAGAAPSLVRANRHLRAQRISLVLGFWLAAGGVYALRRLILLQLHSESESSHQWIELSEAARLWLLLIPIACCCAALALQSCWLPRWGRIASTVAAITIIPILLLITWAIWSL